MKTYENINAKDIKKLTPRLKGIEVIDLMSGTSETNLKSLTLRDTLTGETLRIQISPYSDFHLAIETKPEMVEKFEMEGDLDGMVVKKSFDSKEEAKTFAEEKGVQKFIVTPVQVEKE